MTININGQQLIYLYIKIDVGTLTNVVKWKLLICSKIINYYVIRMQDIFFMMTQQPLDLIYI